MSLKQEFVTLARTPGANIRELCRRYGISPPTAYQLLERHAREGDAGLLERSRRPHNSPNRTPAVLEQAVVDLREEHPAWGGRTLHEVLLRSYHPVPSPSTITAILRRNGCTVGGERVRRDWQRFEHPHPNDLWQMDFKGHFPTGAGRCHPLTVLDDHSRFAILLQACPNERTDTVQECLTAAFRTYGLPVRMLMDNGAPWGNDALHPRTPLTVWLMRLGIQVSHGRPYHPQTQGKEERFHRTLNAEVLQGRYFTDCPACQAAFDWWRDVYNTERPHQALGLATPISRYAPSPRSFPETLPPIEYGDGDLVRKVGAEGWVSFKGHAFKVGRALRGYPVALRPTVPDGVWGVRFLTHPIATVDLRGSEPNVRRFPDV